ncbi:LPS assembly lipoprotein LptE [Paucibacter sp. DJ2R-2]|uniref:LPS-assembly lipoprotein LptE n=1 Tax=Paucibacter sp. DJ2R-2 TaxID=2893558 RepID=UPI0021E472C3|nr:LPS assembly lipoprotein LptE [Paucibacter sp. DJ2R-2]MCV2419684.1 LPS assembly lipoprotein LptE [Paucibacter sp. DJ4R-1]MCV2437413.1 LPS assembly lipoprotein LptE [Paucibacter sp. DJ2R-2]
MSTLLQRRHLLLLAAAPLAGCGFELRREPEFLFRSLALSGFKPGSPLAVDLKRQLSRTALLLVEDANRAELVLEALRDVRERSVVVSTSAGQVREWQLRVNFDYLLRTPSGELLLPRTELRMTREMNYTESTALAKEQEEAQLYRAMQSDAVAQIMRRLSAVRLPA